MKNAIRVNFVPGFISEALPSIGLRWPGDDKVKQCKVYLEFGLRWVVPCSHDPAKIDWMANEVDLFRKTYRHVEMTGRKFIRKHDKDGDLPELWLLFTGQCPECDRLYFDCFSMPSPEKAMT